MKAGSATTTCCRTWWPRSAKFGRRFERFGLFGYSGGGQFVNRYALLHPETLWAVSIGAPGSVTLLDPEQDWWVGVRDAQARFGKAVDAEALRKVAVHMIVGKADLEPGRSRIAKAASSTCRARTRPG